MSKYNYYLKSLEMKEVNLWDVNNFAFKYLFKRLKYLQKEQHLLFKGFSYAKATSKQIDEYHYKDWLINYEIKRTINKIQDVERQLLIKLGVMNETD